MNDLLDGSNCGSTLRTDAEGNFDGWITSPNFGSSYPPSLKCFWLLDASRLAGEVKITDDCMTDFFAYFIELT